MASASLYAAGLVTACALVWGASLGSLAAMSTLIVATFIVLISVLGPARLGAFLIAAAMFTAPMDDVRPSASISVLTVSDVLLVGGFALLVPTLLQRRSRYPLAYAAGCLVLVVALAVASLLSPDPVSALFVGSRLMVAAVVVPLAFLAWRPDQRVIDVLAWSYVAGQVVSTGFALVDGPLINDRYIGLSTHVNYFGHSGVIAICLLLFLHERMPAGRRWIAWVSGAVALGSVGMSGSRAAGVTVVVLLLLFPLIERSVASAYVLLAGAVVLVAAGGSIIAQLSGVPSIDRFFGDSTTATSDQSRRMQLDDNLEKFLSHPLQGHGFDELGLSAHNIYLEVAISLGLFGLIAFLVVLSTTVRPLFGNGKLRRLGYVGLGYVCIGTLTNTLWDRFVWLGLALALLAAAEEKVPESAHRQEDDGDVHDDAVPLRMAVSPRTRG